MTPWHGVYLDWQLVLIWINIQRREKIRSKGWWWWWWGEAPTPTALTRWTWANTGYFKETEVLKCLSSRSWSFFYRCTLQLYTSIPERSQWNGVVFSRSRTYQLSHLMANLCQSEMRVKWPGKSEYSHPFGWHLGDCNHSAHWYALYYVLLTCFQWHSPALAPLL